MDTASPLADAGEEIAMRFVLLVIALLVCVTAVRPASADCPEGTNWTSTWTDIYGETTYTLVAPCKVYLGIPFTITASADDPSYPNNWVGWNWSIFDNGSVIAGGTAGDIILANGHWETSVQQTYTGTAIDHTITFDFTDFGHGSGFHNAVGSSVGGLTVDPYLITLAPSFSLTTTQQGTTTIPATVFNPAGGNPLTYRWLEGATELQAPQPVVGVNEVSIPLDLAAVPALSPGEHTFTLEVTDGTLTGSKSTAVTVISSSPTPVPVMDGWWLLPGMLAGGVLLSRRRMARERIE
jgi:hypothetical protein